MCAFYIIASKNVLKTLETCSMVCRWGVFSGN